MIQDIINKFETIESILWRKNQDGEFENYYSSECEDIKFAINVLKLIQDKKVDMRVFLFVDNYKDYNSYLTADMAPVFGGVDESRLLTENEFDAIREVIY